MNKVLTTIIGTFFCALNLTANNNWNREVEGEANVQIKHHTPSQVNSNSQFITEFSISKPGIEGFARLLLYMPESVSVTARETSSGQFEFKDNKAIIQWYNLPYEDVVNISFLITLTPDVTGEIQITGVFQYLYDNLIQEQKIVANRTRIIETGEYPETPSLKRYSYKKVPLRQIDCIRQKPYINDSNEIIVNMLVNKGNLVSFGKIEEQLPKGFKAYPLKTKGGVFNTVGRIVKIIWMEMPREEMFLVSYRLVEEQDFPNEAFIINGYLSYSLDDKAQIINTLERNIDLTELSPDDLVEIK